MQERIEAHQMKIIKVGNLVVYVHRRSLCSGPSSVSVVQLRLPKVSYLCFPQAKDLKKKKKDLYLIPESNMIFVNRVQVMQFTHRMIYAFK